MSSLIRMVVVHASLALAGVAVGCLLVQRDLPPFPSSSTLAPGPQQIDASPPQQLRPRAQSMGGARTAQFHEALAQAGFPLEARRDALRSVAEEEFRREIAARGWDGLGTNWLSQRDRRERAAGMDALRREQDARLTATGLTVQRYDFLSRENSLRCEAIEREFTARRLALATATNAPGTAQADSQLRREQDTLHRSILSEQEYLQFRLANSLRLRSYASSLAFFEPTASELSRLIELQISTSAQADPTGHIGVSGALVRDVLGPERNEHYGAATEQRSYSARKLAADVGMPDTEAGWILTTHDHYNQALGAIPYAQREQKARLFAEFEQTMRAKLGDIGYRQYRETLGYGMSTHLPWRGR